MFQDKNTNNKQTDFNSSLVPMSPIHLMKNDLAEIKNPKKEISKGSPEPTKPFPNLSEEQKTSPFFNAAKPQKIAENKPKEVILPSAAAHTETAAISPVVPSPTKEPQREIKREAPQKIETSVFSQQKKLLKDLPKKSAENFALNKIILIFAVFFFLLVVGASGYYFWIAKQNKVQPENNQVSNEQLDSQPVAQIKPEKIIEFSTEKPNYFSIDIAIADKNSIIEHIDTYLKRAAEIKITTPIEFIFTDSSNNPIPFKIFAGKVGISFSEETLSALKDTFSFFIYNDSGNYRLGVAIDSTNDINLKAALLKEESILVDALEPILRNPENKGLLKEEKYSQNIYKNVNIRYANIVSPEYLSIDYAVFQKKLIIVTTKNMSRAIIDYLTPVSAKTSVSESIKTSENKTSTEIIQNTTAIDTAQKSVQE